MKYEKPDVLAVGSACSGVQGVPGMGKGSGSNDNSEDRPSIPAYEADE